MAAGPNTQVSDVVVPEIFTPYVQQITEEKSRLVQSGALARNTLLDNFLAGGGLTVNVPSWRDLDNDEENLSSDDPADTFKRDTGDDGYIDTGRTDSIPKKIGSATEIAVRLSRNQSWGTSDLAADLAGSDPMNAIANRVGAYWARRRQAAFVATMAGIFANNATTTDAYHVQNDMSVDISGSAYTPGVTDFSAEAFLDAALTMGDSMDDLGLVMMHSVVYNRALKNNLIDFIPDSTNTNAQPNAVPGRGTGIPTFLGRLVIVDDGMPNTSGVFQTWLFGSGAVAYGVGAPKVPTEVERHAAAGNGGGQEVLYNRVEWVLHPVGHAYIGTPPNSGPGNSSSANGLAAASSWRRVYSERKQIKIARLITREF